MHSFGSSFLVADALPGAGEPPAGDHLQTVYRFWLVGHQLAGGDAPWRDPYSFQPLVEPQFVLGAWPFGLAFWPLDALFGPVLAWNLLLLLTVVAAGLLTYGWLRMLALGPVAAALGGLAFALAPYRLEQSGGHLLGWSALFLPLALLAVERSRAAEGPRVHVWGAVAAASLASIPLAGQLHLALAAVPLGVAYAVLRYRFATAVWCGAGALAALGVGLAVRYTLIAGSLEGSGRSLQEVGEFSAEPGDFLSRTQTGGSEDFVFLGWFTPLLALAGLAILFRRSRGLAVLLGIAAVVPALLALGTHLPLYSFLWDVFPPIRFPRVPARLLPVADLALAALAAFAAALLLERAGRRALVGAALLAVVAVDLGVRPLETAAADPGNGAYRALTGPPAERMLELPLFQPGVHFASVYDYYSLQAARERPSGYSTLAPERVLAFYFELNRISCGVWLPRDEERLASLGVENVVFHRGMYVQGKVPGAYFAWRALADAGFGDVVRDGAVTLFRRERPATAAPIPEPSRERPVLCEGWRGRTMVERQAPLWIYGSGELEVGLTAPGETTASLWIDGRPRRSMRVAHRGSLVVPLGDEGWHAVLVEVPRLFPTKPPRGFRLESLTLRPAP
jgi:hypothetical protein